MTVDNINNKYALNYIGFTYGYILDSSLELSLIIAPLSDIPMFYIKYMYLTMYKVQRHADVIRQLLYGCAYVREIILSLKLVDYPPVHTHKRYITYTCIMTLPPFL